MNGDAGNDVLKGVSRSFYLTLRLLPQPMRRAASLGYLLARTSDTLADTAAAPTDVRMECLGNFVRALVGGSGTQRWPAAIIHSIADPRERRLLECSDELFKLLRNLPPGEAALVREVVAIIVSGQILDLQRFAGATCGHPIALQDEAALEDYAWRVAGCVGAFWTRLGFLTLGRRFSTTPEPVLLEQGIAYGKGLQLVNILRDLGADLAAGRCYLPVADPRNPGQILACHAHWLDRAELWISQGPIYAESLCTRRLRAATALPALLARKTLEPLRGATWDMLQTRIKVPRRVVYQSVIGAFLKGRRNRDGSAYA